ncbi:MAG: hypothetical protein OXC92_04900 [Flavobacteriaceae bacterium]|nr:hypothetical protein [Flavobacteriaceae bacterium]
MITGKSVFNVIELFFEGNAISIVVFPAFVDPRVKSKASRSHGQMLRIDSPLALNIGRWNDFSLMAIHTKSAPLLRYGAHTISRIVRWSEDWQAFSGGTISLDYG